MKKKHGKCQDWILTAETHQIPDRVLVLYASILDAMLDRGIVYSMSSEVRMYDSLSVLL